MPTAAPLPILPKPDLPALQPMARRGPGEFQMDSDSEEEREGVMEEDEDEEVRPRAAGDGGRLPHCAGALRHPARALFSMRHGCRLGTAGCSIGSVILNTQLAHFPLLPQPILAVRARQGGPANRLPLHHFLRLIAGHGRMMEHGAHALGVAAVCAEARQACAWHWAQCLGVCPSSAPAPGPSHAS